MSTAAISAEAEQRIVACNISQHRNLCDEIQRLLPREVRDMIYTHLLSENVHYDLPATYDDPIRTPTPKVLEKFLHARDSAYIGSKAYAELVETWYRLTVFRLNGCSYVVDLFDLKQWNLADDVNSRHQVRNVHITVQPGKYNAKEHYTEPEDVLMPKDFDMLAQLQRPATVTIVLDISSWKYYNTADHNVKPFVAFVYEVVSPTLERLMTADIKVAVQIDSAMPVYLTKDDLNMDYLVKLYERRNVSSSSPSTSIGPYDTSCITIYYDVSFWELNVW
jgi:hypothetical protein